MAKPPIAFIDVGGLEPLGGYVFPKKKTLERHEGQTSNTIGGSMYSLDFANIELRARKASVTRPPSTKHFSAVKVGSIVLSAPSLRHRIAMGRRTGNTIGRSDKSISHREEIGPLCPFDARFNNAPLKRYKSEMIR